MNVTADRTEEFGLASVGWDDEGVQAQRWDLVRDGVFVGYQLDRVFAPRLGMARSNGCSYADSPHHVPIQRMANVSLQPGADDLSTDDLIAPGARTGSTSSATRAGRSTCSGTTSSSPARGSSESATASWTASCVTSLIRPITTDFWGAMEAVGGPSTWRLGGAFNCGKAQPGQVAPVSHGCPSALFRGVNVLNTRTEGGR